MRRAAQRVGRRVAAGAAVCAAAGVGACGGGGAERPPEPVTRTPTLTGAAVAPGAAEVPLDSGVALRVEPTWSSTASSGPTTSAVTVTWTRRGTAGGAVTPDAGDGRGASYRASSVGVDTVEAAVAPAGGTAGTAVTARAVVTVRGPRVARVAFPARVAYVGVGGTFALPAVGRDPAGAAVTKAVLTYRALDAVVATVGPDGTLSGMTVGTARMVAEASTVTAPGAALPADTLRVVVAGDAGTLALGLVDTVAQAGRPVTLVGVDGGATAALGGTPVSVTAAGAPGTVSLTPPADVFAGSNGLPCRPLGATTPLTLTTGGRARTLALPVHAPLVVALAPGQHRRVTEAARGGCPVAVDAAGTYVAMPFAWESGWPAGTTAAAPPSPTTTAVVVAAGVAPDAPTTAAVLGAAAISSAGARPTTVRLDRGSRLVRPRVAPRVPGVVVRGDVVEVRPTRAYRSPASSGLSATRLPNTVGALRAAATSVATTWPTTWAGTVCPIPTVLGDSMPVGIWRGPDGRVRMPAATPEMVTGGDAVGRVESWTLAATRPSVAVFVDSSLARAKAGIPGAQARLDAFADAYESTVAPLLARYTPGVPRHDGTGRVIVLVALRAENALAYPNGYVRPDCPYQPGTPGVNGQPGTVGYRTDVGAAVLLGGDAFVAEDRLVAPAVSVAAHESAHLVDTDALAATRGGVLRADTWWSREGYAVLLQSLWTLPESDVATAFRAERAAPAYRTVLGTSQGGFCERPDRAVLGTWYTLTGDGYPLACQAVRYALSQLAQRDPGLTTRDLLARWTALPDRRRLVDALDGLLGGGPAAGACVPNGNTTLPNRTTVAVCRPALRAVPAAHAGDRAGAFYLSWVADGVAGAAPETQDAAADVRTLAKVWYPQLAVPAATLAPGGRLTATLGEPDALHVEVALPARGWVAVTGGGGEGLPTDRSDFVVFRMR